MTSPFSYAGKRAVVTGAASGVGVELINVLRELDVAEVTGLDRNHARGVDTLFPPEVVRAINLNLIGDGGTPDDPYAFPGNGAVGGQPPVFILNSEADTLRASGELYVQQLAFAEVHVEVEVEPGTGHGHVNDPYSEGGQRSIERIARCLSRW